MPADGTDLARQLRLHLESLRAAGVEFVPAAAPVQLAAPEPVLDHAPPHPPDGPARAEPALAGASGWSGSTLLEQPKAAVPNSPDSRRHELGVLAELVSRCDRCSELYSTRTQTVFGVGPVDPDVCFVGEAPGADEDAQGEPFVGRAGQLLNRIITLALGMRREDVYICNTLKCRPPNNRTPSPEERANCREYFDAQLALVKPKYIVCLGATAAKNVLGVNLGIGKLRGRVYHYNGIPVVCTYHPSAILREEPATTLRAACWEDMKLLLRTMGRPVPNTKQ